MKPPTSKTRTPRPLTYRDLDMARGTSDIELGLFMETDEPVARQMRSQLYTANRLNAMVPQLEGFDRLPLLPGDVFIRALGSVSKPARPNPWHKA